MATMHVLRDLREEQGLTLRELAAKSGLSVGTIARAELGQTQPYGRSLWKLARALGVPISTLRPCGPVAPAPQREDDG